MIQGRSNAFWPASKVSLFIFALLAWSFFAQLWAGSGQAPNFELQEADGQYFFLFGGLTEEVLSTFSREGELNSVLVVHLAGVEEQVPGLLGRVSIIQGAIVFHPRFPLQPGMTYRVQFRPGRSGLEPQNVEFPIPASEYRPPAEIVEIYPTSRVLPENLLKFYLHFSSPMSRGDVYRYIRLFQGDEEVELPFLEMEQELWDSDHQRLTLLIDPGRIKRGLVPHTEAGTALVSGRTYRLLIERHWPDEAGEPLLAGFEKIFRVVESDRTPPDPEKWVLTRPQAGGFDPLNVEFGKPMDQALVMRLLQIKDSFEATVSGRASLAEEESVWSFRPDDPWRAGDYSLVFAKTLEDLAGNRIGRPFEVDVFEPVQEKVVEDMVSLPFRITR